MKYKDAFFFIASCLTIESNTKNRNFVLDMIKSNELDWDTIVKVSSEHLVLTAMYSNLKKVKFLKYLPKELCKYLSKINNINRERNKEIIKQAKEINELLVNHKISPIFLKGTANLLEDLYSDISERMVGDIDILCSKKEYQKTIQILVENGYTYVHDEKYYIPSFMHHPRLKINKRIAAIEIHQELIIKKYSKIFNYEYIIDNVRNENGFYLLGYEDQISLSIIANQVNDFGFYFNDISLRNAYDIFLLSFKIDNIFDGSRINSLSKHCNFFIAVCNNIFGEIKNFDQKKSEETENDLSKFIKLISNDKKRKVKFMLKKMNLFFKERFRILYSVLMYKNYRAWFIKTITDWNWYKKKLSIIFTNKK